MKQSPEEHYQRVTKLIELSENVVKNSTILPDDEKQTFLEDYQINRSEAQEALQANNTALLRQLEYEILTPWNETADEDSHHFWKLAKDEGLGARQEDGLDKVLKRGSLANSKEYDMVQDSMVIWQQEGKISEKQAAKLGAMLADYERKKAN